MGRGLLERVHFTLFSVRDIFCMKQCFDIIWACSGPLEPDGVSGLVVFLNMMILDTRFWTTQTLYSRLCMLFRCGVLRKISLRWDFL